MDEMTAYVPRLHTLDLNEVTHALADTLDLVGVDDVGHGKRVAFMARACGMELGFSDEELEYLFDAAILHDCGVSSTALHQKLVAELDYRHADIHCVRGASLLEEVESYARLAPVVLWHHTHWEQLLTESLPAETALVANLVFLTDRADAFTAQAGGSATARQREVIRTRIASHSAQHFSPELVEAFLAASDSEEFWLGLEPEALRTNLTRRLRNPRAVTMDFPELRSLAALFSNVVDTKSPFTQEHSVGVSRLARRLGEWVGLPEATCDQLEIAGLLHDLGKLRVPDEILDKPGALDDREIAVIHRHSYDSYQILSQVAGWEHIARWAGMHHETLIGDGYPFHYGGEQLGVEARIIAVADIFQALSQARPYRDSLPPERVLGIMRTMVEQKHIDGNLVELVARRLHESRAAALGLEP